MDRGVHESIECGHVEAELWMIFLLAPCLEWVWYRPLKAVFRPGRGWLGGQVPHGYRLFVLPFDSLRSRNIFALWPDVFAKRMSDLHVLRHLQK